MKKYKNKSGRSGISKYNTGIDFIEVVFLNSDNIYTYSYQKAGRKHVEKMKLLADQGEGLNSYINDNTHDLYDK